MSDNQALVDDEYTDQMRTNTQETIERGKDYIDVGQ